MSSVIDSPKLLTTADLLAMPDDGVERWLIRGQLRENRESDITRRNRYHSECLAVITALLMNWRNQQPEPRGKVLAGEAGSILSHDPETTVGIDVAYFDAETVQHSGSATTMMDGPPALAVEILSPSDKNEDIDEKVDAYLDAGVKLVWIVDPHLEIITVVRPDAPTRSYNVTESIDAEPHLPGFRAPVAEIFE
jgi:Uma2 family endonuclease